MPPSYPGFAVTVYMSLGKSFFPLDQSLFILRRKVITFKASS